MIDWQGIALTLLELVAVGIGGYAVRKLITQGECVASIKTAVETLREQHRQSSIERAAVVDKVSTIEVRLANLTGQLKAGGVIGAHKPQKVIRG